MKPVNLLPRATIEKMVNAYVKGINISQRNFIKDKFMNDIKEFWLDFTASVEKYKDGPTFIEKYPCPGLTAKFVIAIQDKFNCHQDPAHLFVKNAVTFTPEIKQDIIRRKPTKYLTFYPNSMLINHSLWDPWFKVYSQYPVKIQGPLLSLHLVNMMWEYSIKWLNDNNLLGDLAWGKARVNGETYVVASKVLSTITWALGTTRSRCIERKGVLYPINKDALGLTNHVYKKQLPLKIGKELDNDFQTIITPTEVKMLTLMLSGDPISYLLLNDLIDVIYDSARTYTNDERKRIIKGLENISNMKVMLGEKPSQITVKQEDKGMGRKNIRWASDRLITDVNIYDRSLKGGFLLNMTKFLKLPNAGLMRNYLKATAMWNDAQWKNGIRAEKLKIFTYRDWAFLTNGFSRNSYIVGKKTHATHEIGKTKKNLKALEELKLLEICHHTKDYFQLLPPKGYTRARKTLRIKSTKN